MSKLLAMMMKPKNYMYATIKGSLTETPAGVFSGFSGTNYLALQQPFILNANTIAEVVVKVNTPTLKTNNAFVATDISRGIYINITGTGLIQLYVGNGTDWVINQLNGTHSLSANTDYYIKINFNNNVATISISTDNVNWIQDIQANMNLDTTTNYIIKLGARSSTQYFNGSIDINQSYIKLQNTKYQLQAVVGYTVIGSPTIVDGVVSGFSGSDYLQLNNFNNIETNNIELCIKYTPTTLTTTRLLATADSGTTFTGIVVGNSSPNYFRFFIYGNNTQYIVTSSVTAQANTNYYIIAYRKGNKIGIKVSSDGINYTTDEITIPDNLSLTNANKLYFGLNKNSGASFINGSIDLNETYIKINNKLLFNGQEG